MDKDKQFQKEVTWCIEQLRMGMLNKRPTEKQAKECERVIKILLSNKASLVKKRQAMQQMFGDYRKKIEADEKACEKEIIKQLQTMKISSKDDKKQGKFIKPANSMTARTVSDNSSSPSNNRSQEDSGKTNIHSELIDNEHLLSKDSSDSNANDCSIEFKFNFKIET